MGRWLLWRLMMMMMMVSYLDRVSVCEFSWYGRFKKKNFFIAFSCLLFVWLWGSDKRGWADLPSFVFVSAFVLSDARAANDARRRENSCRVTLTQTAPCSVCGTARECQVSWVLTPHDYTHAIDRGRVSKGHRSPQTDRVSDNDSAKVTITKSGSDFKTPRGSGLGNDLPPDWVSAD